MVEIKFNELEQTRVGSQANGKCLKSGLKIWIPTGDLLVRSLSLQLLMASYGTLLCA